MFFRRDKMTTILFSANMDTINEWKMRHDEEDMVQTAYDVESLSEEIAGSDEYLIVADYDSVATEINKMISSNTLDDKMIVLEKTPEVLTGKMLIGHSVKAYGNARMLKMHYIKMLQTVENNRVWTYPELTAALASSAKKESLSPEALELLDHRLSTKEKEVVLSVVEGLTNDAIATKLDITQRTVKAHMSSIFSKLHINDRLALVLLLK